MASKLWWLIHKDLIVEYRMRQAWPAMFLLGINCGFGNADCGTLPLSALDLDGCWINFPRPKTASLGWHTQVGGSFPSV